MSFQNGIPERYAFCLHLLLSEYFDWACLFIIKDEMLYFWRDTDLGETKWYC